MGRQRRKEGPQLQCPNSLLSLGLLPSSRFWLTATTVSAELEEWKAGCFWAYL